MSRFIISNKPFLPLTRPPVHKIMLGIFCVGAVSIMLGSVFGTAMGYVVDVVAGFGRAKETEEVKAHN